MMTFDAFLDEVLTPALAPHPESEVLDFGEARWRLDGKDFTPRGEASLVDNGIDHKSQLRLVTPRLSELADVAI